MEKVNFDFSIPQKQSATGIIVMFADTLQKIIRALALPAILIIAKSGMAYIAYVLLGIAVVVLLIAVFAYFRYQRFTFYLDEAAEEFVINEGVFIKTNLTIPLDKIQQVNINQSLLQRIIGVYTLQIDTAGTDKKEGSIRAINKPLADELKLRLLSRELILDTSDDTVENARKNEQQAVPFLKLSPFTLLKIGVTSNYGQTIALVLAFLAAGFQNLKDFSRLFKVDEDQVGQVIRHGFTLVSVFILILVVVVLLLVVNIIRTFIKFFDFEVFKQKHSLIVNSGLLSKKNTSLSAHRVQVTMYSQNYFQRKMDMLDMRMKQNATVTQSSKQAKNSDIEIPGCNKDEKDKILKMIFNEVPEKGVQLAPNYRFVFLTGVIWILLPALLFSALNYWTYPILNYSPLMIAYILMAGIMLYFSFRNHRLYVSKDYIIKKQGIWDVEHLIIEPHKIQAITIKQYLWHKKANIGHITCHTAAGNLAFRFGDYTTLKNLMNYWLYQVESSGKDWM